MWTIGVLDPNVMGVKVYAYMMIGKILFGHKEDLV